MVLGTAVNNNSAADTDCELSGWVDKNKSHRGRHCYVWSTYAITTRHGSGFDGFTEENQNTLDVAGGRTGTGTVPGPVRQPGGWIRIGTSASGVVLADCGGPWWAAAGPGLISCESLCGVRCLWANNCLVSEHGRQRLSTFLFDVFPSTLSDDLKSLGKRPDRFSRVSLVRKISSLLRWCAYQTHTLSAGVPCGCIGVLHAIVVAEQNGFLGRKIGGKYSH